MCSEGVFVEYDSYQLPLGEIYSDDLSENRARQLSEIVRLKLVYDLVYAYKEQAEGKNIEGSVMVQSVKYMKADDLSPILAQHIGK